MFKRKKQDPGISDAKEITANVFGDPQVSHRVQELQRQICKYFPIQVGRLFFAWNQMCEGWSIIKKSEI